LLPFAFFELHFEAAFECGASGWLTILPIADRGSEAGMFLASVCGKSFTVQTCMPSADRFATMK